MSGRLDLATPWAREAIGKEDRRDVIDAIPDGWLLGVSVSPNKGQWYFWTIDPDGHKSSRLTVSSSMALRAACFYALRHWRLGERLVTTDAEGNIRSITDAD